MPRVQRGVQVLARRVPLLTLLTPWWVVSWEGTKGRGGMREGLRKERWAVCARGGRREEAYAALAVWLPWGLVVHDLDLLWHEGSDIAGRWSVDARLREGGSLGDSGEAHEGGEGLDGEHVGRLGCCRWSVCIVGLSDCWSMKECRK